MELTILDSYPTTQQAKEATLHLIEKGYPKTAITIFCTETQAPAFLGLEVPIETQFSPKDTDPSFASTTLAFLDEVELDADTISHYRDALANGEVIIIVNEDPTYLSHTPHTNEEIILDGPLDISQQNEDHSEGTDYLIE